MASVGIGGWKGKDWFNFLYETDHWDFDHALTSIWTTYIGKMGGKQGEGGLEKLGSECEWAVFMK